MYRTSDFHLATTLCALSFKLNCIDETNPKRCVFEFEDDSSITQHVEAYFRGELKMDPRLILLNSKLLKDRLYNR